MSIIHRCFSFSTNTLAEILCENIVGLNKDKYFVLSKKQVQYLQGYLEDIKCQTVLFEFPYIDRDYLEDYSNYYSRCFTGYERRCARLHFFDLPFDDSDFLDLLKNPNTAIKQLPLDKHYLGFCVINPLPNSFIGRTCLKTYNDDLGRRRYKATRAYHAHLFGLDFSVDSLAFQEQDSTVAACATSALWTAFHGSGILFQHSIPSPVEITKLATQYVIQPKRSFPSHDLTFYQITHAIKSLGLDPVMIPLNHNAKTLQANVYAYLSAGIPLLLLLLSNSGGHAVAVTGYSLEGNKPEAADGYNIDFKIKSTLVNKIYVHDDQRGPFARAELFDAHGALRTYDELQGYNFQYGYLIAPVYHKIRIGYQTIVDVVHTFHIAFKYITTNLSATIAPCWDIYLSTSTQFKDECIKSTSITEEERIRSLRKELPRFIWVATATELTSQEIQFSLVFDATDITGGCLLVHDVEHKFPFIPALRELFDAATSSGTSLQGLELLDAWLKQLQDT